MIKVGDLVKVEVRPYGWVQGTVTDIQYAIDEFHNDLYRITIPTYYGNPSYVITYKYKKDLKRPNVDLTKQTR